MLDDVGAAAVASLFTESVPAVMVRAFVDMSRWDGVELRTYARTIDAAEYVERCRSGYAGPVVSLGWTDAGGSQTIELGERWWGR
jgi:hypothetical protein